MLVVVVENQSLLFPKAPAGRHVAPDGVLSGGWVALSTNITLLRS